MAEGTPSKKPADKAWTKVYGDNAPNWMIPQANIPADEIPDFALCIIEKKDFIAVFTLDDAKGTFDDHKDAIFGAISACPRLTYVSLARSNLDDKVCNSIRAFLAVTTSCTKLILKDNLFTEVGMKTLAMGLRKNNCVKALDLEKNVQALDLGVKALLSAFTIGGNTVVEELLLDHCGTTPAIEDDIELTLTENDSLSRLTYGVKDKKKSVVDKLNTNAQNIKDKFLRDMKGENKGRWNRSKLMFIGQGRAGKTTTVKRLLGKKFHETEDSTVGASVTQTQSSTTKLDQWKDLESGDAAFFGQGMKPNVALNAIAAKNVINKNQAQAQKDAEEKKRQQEELAKKEAIENLRKQQQIERAKRRKNNLDFDDTEIEVETDEKENDNMAEVQRKLDEMSERANRAFDKFTKHENKDSPFGKDAPEQDVSTRFADTLFLASQESKETITFALWDYGGQTVFYSLHHLFLSKFGIYVLCVDMREILNRPEVAEQYLLFWLNSVKLHAPDAPVFLVGTYLDEIKDESELLSVNKFIGDKLTPKFPQLVSFNENYNFFPVDNKNNKNVKNLRNWIEKVSRDQEFVKAQVSLRWLGALDKIMNMKDSQGKSPAWLTLTAVRETAHQVGISSETELEDMLELFHELGVIVRLTGTEDLRNIITLDPQWLVDGLCRVIRDNKLHMLKEEDVEKAGLSKDMAVLYEKGLASRDLMEFLWQDPKWRGHVDFLLDLMKYMVLISDWNFREEPLYVIPSLLTPRPEEDTDLFASPDPAYKAQKAIADIVKETAPVVKESKETKLGVKDTAKETKPNGKLIKEVPKVIKDAPKKVEEAPKKVEEVKKVDETIAVVPVGIPEVTEKEETTVTDYAVFDFSKLFLPMGVFQRLVCLCVSYSTLIGVDNKYKNAGKKAAEPKLFTRWAEIWMGLDTVMFLQQRGDEIWLSVQHPETASTCLKAVKSMLSKLNADLMGAGLRWQTSFRTVRRVVKQKKGEKAVVREVVEKEVQQPRAKKEALKPWYEAVKEHKQQAIKVDMLNLGGFVDDFMA